MNADQMPDLDYIARQYFAEPELQEKAVNAMEDAIRALKTNSACGNTAKAGEQEAKAEVCIWRLTDEDQAIWESDCGQAWTFIDGGPVENNVHFCHGCGKPMQEEQAEAQSKECQHKNGTAHWDYYGCNDCGWIKPCGQHRGGPHHGWFPSMDAVREYDKFKTYPGMNEVKPISRWSKEGGAE